MEQTKKRKPQKNVTLRDMTYEQLHAYCQEHQIKHSEFVEIALHTFLHIHGNPKDICKNVVKEHALQDKMMEDLMKTLLKSNRLQKKILGMGIFNEEEEPIEEVITPESIDLKGLLLKAQNKEALTAFEAGVLIGMASVRSAEDNLKKEVLQTVITIRLYQLLNVPNGSNADSKFEVQTELLSKK